MVSDLHIGDHGPRDNFTNIDLVTESGELVSRPGQFGLFLDMVKRDGGNLLIIGDMFELWQSNVGDVLSKNIGLLDELAGLENLLIILGNHDMDLYGLVACRELRLQDAHPIFSKIHVSGKTPGDSRKIFIRKFGDMTYGFIHGNEIDHYNSSSVPGVGRAITILAGIIEDAVGGPYLPKSKKLVEEDLLEKVDFLKWESIKVLFRLFVSRRVIYTALLFLLWTIAVFFVGNAVATSRMYTNIPFFLALFGAIFLPLLGLLVIGFHGYRVIADATVKAGGSMLEYLGVWQDKLPDSQTAMANKDRSTLIRDRNLIEEIRSENGCDMIIMGHTHVDDIREGLCNSGTWANSTPSYLRILPDGTIDLYRWQAVDSREGKGILRKRFNAATREISQIESFKHRRM